MRGLRWQALSELFLLILSPWKEQKLVGLPLLWSSHVANTMMRTEESPCHRICVVSLKSMAKPTNYNSQILTSKSLMRNQQLDRVFELQSPFFHFFPHKNDIWTFLVIAWRKLRCRKFSQCRSAVVIAVPLFFRESHWSPTNVKVIYHRIHRLAPLLTYWDE